MSSWDKEALSILHQFGLAVARTGHLLAIKANEEYKWSDVISSAEFDSEFVKDLFLRDMTKAMFLYVEGKLQKDFPLEKVTIPIDRQDSEHGSFILHTKNCSKQKRVVLLIPSIGPYGIGIWNTKTAMTHGLIDGSQLLYLRMASKLSDECKEKYFKGDYGVVLLNTNMSQCKRRPIRGNVTPTDHLIYVWNNILVKWKAKFDIITYSDGWLPGILWLSGCPEIWHRIRKIAAVFSHVSELVFDTETEIVKSLLRSNQLAWTLSRTIDSEQEVPFPCISVERNDLNMASVCRTVWAYLRSNKKPSTFSRHPKSIVVQTELQQSDDDTDAYYFEEDSDDGSLDIERAYSSNKSFSSSSPDFSPEKTETGDSDQSSGW